MDELISLSNASLEKLPANVRVPGYDRSKLSAGIVHIGVGNFHRAHQAWYLHRLFERGHDHDWAIVGAGVREYDRLQREKFLEQDCLTTLIELAPSGLSAEICGSMTDYVPVETDNVSLISQMADPAIRIVSLTVTEGGYYINPASEAFDTVHPDITHDASNPDTPRTAFGAIVAALRRRRENGAGPFTVMSCDNLKSNGDVSRRTVVSLAKLSDVTLGDWIDANCSFPNSMVDCIVPATGPVAISQVRDFAIDDKVPVTHEDFRQWVMEDDFCAGRPSWDKAGVIFSDFVHAFEIMKLRILNGGHQIVAVAGELLGLDTIAQSMANASVRGLLEKVTVEEIFPNVASVPGTTPSEYFAVIKQRFANEQVADTNRRVAFDGSSRQPGFIVPSILDGLTAGYPVSGLALVSAIWARYCQGKRENGSIIEPNDPHWQELGTVANMAKDNPLKWLEMQNYYGDLAQNEAFADAFVMWLDCVNTSGLESAIGQYLETNLK